MKNFVRYIAIVSALLGMFACEMLEPVDENRLGIDYIGSDPESAEGILLQGYTGLFSQFTFTETATDDAVNNKMSNGYKRMATGELSAQFNPLSRWSRFENVFYLNHFLDIVAAGTVQWSRDSVMNRLFDERLKGEALALRGLHHFYVLQAHAGVGNASGVLEGIPYFDDFIPSDGDFNLPRLTFEQSVKAIMDDFDAALNLLPTVYSDNEADVHERYADVDHNKYKTANGKQYDLRISGRIVKGLKARLALFAASPAFLNSEAYYQTAATAAGEVLSSIGGISSLAAGGNEFYTSDNVPAGEMLWRGTNSGSNNATNEKKCFPPSANGTGEINPTHNLVMAFPMKNGFPATAANGYDPQNPYADRDPRLAKYIVVNGSSIGGKTINTGLGGGVDRLDSISERSTLTGYYLRKLLRPDVKINDDGSEVTQKHYNVYFRYTELFLILAEAANEIGGPDHQVEGMSARDVLAAIRQRAGISQPDAYLASITSKEDMREIIRNERRLELCFEGHRFWDMRRWDLPLNETATGYFHNGNGYEEIPTVEERKYPSHATYMPLPYKEILKYSELEQNKDW